MAMIPPDPQSAADYDDRTTVAVKTVLIELGQILGSFQGRSSVIGGVVPWLLLDQEDRAWLCSAVNQLPSRTPSFFTPCAR